MPEKENEAGRISGDYGRDHPMGRMGISDRAPLPQWKARPSANRDRDDAEDVSAVMLVQSVRRGSGGRHLRQLRHAEIHGDQFF